MPAVLVASDRFGELDIADDRILQFPEGLLGFPTARRFAMVDSHDTGTYYWLQSLEDPSLAFLTVVPWAFFPEYEPELPRGDQDSLALTDPADALVLCILTVQREAKQITANLLGPLVVNAKTRVGRQVVLAESGYPVRAPLAA
jgi:flagellar assembly factor FliW